MPTANSSVWRDENQPPIPFPRQGSRGRAVTNPTAARLPGNEPSLGSPSDVLASLATVSRRINDLARELKCLGYFDDEDDDRPRAA